MTCVSLRVTACCSVTDAATPTVSPPKGFRLRYSFSSSTNGCAARSPTAASTIAPTPITSRPANSKPPTIAPTKPFNRSSICWPLDRPVAILELFSSAILQARIYSVGLNLQGAGDPDQTLPLLYGCGSEFNRNNYCNPEVEKLIDRQSSEVDQEKRKQLVWQIERKLAEDDARPIIFYSRDGTCRQPHVKGLTLMVNSIFNGWRMEDVWLDR